LLDIIKEKLSLSVSPEIWWQEHASLSPVRRFITYLRDVVLAEVEGQVVIFVDEIDSTRCLDFSDDFFAAIRAMYNVRAPDPIFRRLTFVLLGVVSPSDLIKDSTISPFNIGQRIDLQEFDLPNANVLQDGLEKFHPHQGETIFTRIYYWTNGHPYLTQKLCLAAADTKDGPWTEKQVDELVKQLFLSIEVSEERNLQSVEKWILENDRRRDLLKLYKQIYKERKISDDKQSNLQNHLKLSGLVKSEKGCLRVRNEIYRSVFNSNWIKENTHHDWKRILISVTAALPAMLLVILGFIFWYNTFRVPDLADKAELDFHRAHNNPEEQLIALATLFEKQGLGGTPNYDDKARELFFELPAEEQLALFKVENDKIIIVIKGLYITLADVSNTNSSGLLLETMVDALEKFDETKETNTLLAETRSWVQGRILAKQSLYDPALTEYNQAITLNNENLATSYERARVLTQLGRYEAALNDLDRIIGGVRQISDVTPTPQLTDTVTPIHTSTITDLTSISVTVTSLPISIGTPSPTSILLPTSFSSEFMNTGQIINAVRNLINNNSNLANYLAEFPDPYSNLQNFELVPPLFPFAVVEQGNREFQKTTDPIITIIVAVVTGNNTPIGGLKIIGDHAPSGKHLESAVSSWQYDVVNDVVNGLEGYIKQGNVKFEPGVFEDGTWNIYLADENGTQLSPVVSLSYSAAPEQRVWDFIIFKTLTLSPTFTLTPSPSLTPITTATKPATDTSTPTPIDTSTPTPSSTPITTATKPVTQSTPTPIDTSTPTQSLLDFVIVEQRMLTIEENGGCQGGHEIFVTILDVNGNPLEGVIVGDTFNNVEVVSGTNGPGKSSITLWMNSMSLKVKGHIDGTPYTSEESFNFTSHDELIPLVWLQQSGYCDSPEDCQQRVENNQLCRGHYSYEIVFQKTH
jgi:tetratricopeptide (TPR) repeat protein